ncbi:MAG TPA: glutathione synthetase [Acidimicrobiia bacterium]|jgi:glutathione synthase|nr:glutathione synthetase [Acidimicrobiia bacterium]
MKIGFVINSIATEKPEYTTVRLALAATKKGNETWMMGVDDFSHRPDGTVAAHARTASRKKHTSPPAFLDSVKDAAQGCEDIAIADLDVLVMRNDPADDLVERPWAVTSGILFAQLSVAAGTLVVNDPAGLANAVNKTYFQHFPDAVRPRTLISRDPDDISAFVKEIGGGAVLKPLQGSGGASVFFVSDDESPNLNQMIEAVGRDGYIVAQENLAEAEQGDVRLFLMNGEPLVAGGKYAAFRRVNATADPRSNMRVGGEAEPVKVDDAMLEVAEAVRPKLLADGMFLVGLDIVGDKLMEVNVFSPGGLGSCETLYKAKFCDAVIDALEHKVELREQYRGALSNGSLATL